MRDFHLPGRSAVFANDGLCATSHPLAAQTAISVLKEGGNAMDAAIAGAVLLGLCEPQMTGIGGDCFVLFSPAGSNDVRSLNGSGCAPKNLSASMLRDKGHGRVVKQSVDAITVPGAIDAFCQLNSDWGNKSLAEVLAPAIHYARAGVPVAPRVRLDWNRAVSNLHPSAQPYFTIDGRVPNIGELFYAPKQAEVLERIAKEGRDGFYTGEVAHDIVTSLNALGGVHSLEDFAAQRAFYTDPISISYGDIELFEHPPNGQGATAILLLNILSQFDLGQMDPFGAERAHIEAEATKVAYGLRNEIIADPARCTNLDEMLSPETAKALASRINLKVAQKQKVLLDEMHHKDTIYITVVDKDRMAVSLIYSIFDSFGSGIASEKYGILLQNRGAGFSLKSGHANELIGGNRPMHTIIPAILQKDGQTMMPFGVMGGQYQSTGHARFVTNFVDFGLSPQEAIDAPRSFAEDNILKVERGYAPEVVQSLSDMGHDIVQDMEPIGGAQAIQIHENGVLEGASDPRKDGCALGY